MQPFICGKFIDCYVIVSRFGNVGIVIKKKLFSELVRLSMKKNSRIPKHVNDFLIRLGYTGPKPQKLNDIFLVRSPTNLNFGRASYEITERCNYNCSHCYLDRKSNKSLSITDKRRILKLIEKSGCIWLQITGGEPLISKDFIQTYSFAYSLGFLITLSTNGSLLTKPHITKTLLCSPPYRLTISMYGATPDSYEALTRTSGSFQRFLNGLNWAKENGIRTRLNIIVTQHNEKEINAMINLAKNFGSEYYIFPKLSPTIKGDSTPMEIMAKDYEDIQGRDRFVTREIRHTKCMAGKTFFHMNSLGRMSICKVAREPSVNLLNEGIDGFNKLSKIAEQLLKPFFSCKSCALKNSCTTCSPRLALYQRSKIIPPYICNKL